MATTRAILPTKDDLRVLLIASGLLTDANSASLALLDYGDAIGAATREWEMVTGYMPYIAAYQTRLYDPPGPERGPVGIYVGINNMGGGRKLFVNSGIPSLSTLTVGVTGGTSSLTGTIAGTVTAGVFSGTYTGVLTTSGTFTGTGIASIADSGTGTGTLTFAISGSGAGPTSITGVVVGSATGSVTGTATLTGTTNGSVLTAGADYWLRPQNAPQYYRPYTYIEFAYPQWGNPQSIALTGLFGFSAVIAEDAWQAVLYMAGISLIPSIEAITHGGLSSVRLGEDTFTFAGGGRIFASLTEQWQAKVNKTLGRYKRVVIA